MSIGIFMPALLINPEIRVILPSGNLVDDRMGLLFTPEEWASSTTKRVIVEAGTEVGTNSRNYVIATGLTSGGQAGSFNGRLIFENNGIVSGRGGAANGGVGGNAIYANLPGRNGQKLEIINRGTLRAGGGGGGRGGTGGGGSYQSTVREPASGYVGNTIQESATHTWYTPGSSGERAFIKWDSVEVTEGFNSGLTTVVVGNSTYYRGPSYGQYAGGYYGERYYNLYRIVNQTTNTNGGAGGNGGTGQGFGQGRTNGVAGANGGTNAGKGGTGGNGGAYGASGTSGATGANGNRTNGVAGSAGGLSGFYIDGDNNVEWKQTGERLGRAK